MHFILGTGKTMELTGLHILLTYVCNMTCDHCFVWGSPEQRGTWTWVHLQDLLRQAQEIPTLNQIYFEGGEPFLYYPLMEKGIQEASRLGFNVGIVTNAYWALTVEDAKLWLEPLATCVNALSVSSDLYHGNQDLSKYATNAVRASEELGIPVGVISIAQPTDPNARGVQGVLPDGLSEVRYRGRAAHKLADQAPTSSVWSSFSSCPYEDLRSPSRIHVDPLGYLHLCQGITIGHLSNARIWEVVESYQPRRHPIIGPLLLGGPANLVRTYDLNLKGSFADACHLCDLARHQLRCQFPNHLGPDQMYGLP